MTNLEFVLTNANINTNNISEDEIKFIDETLIPQYESMSNPIFGSSIVISHRKTNEVRRLNVKEIVNSLKNFLNNL